MPAAPQSRHAIDLNSDEFREMHRSFSVERASINKEARTVELSFASEQPVERWFGREILDISPEACDLTRLKNGGAVLMNHDWRDQVGVVSDVKIDAATKKARCVARFSSSVRGNEIFQDIQDGIRSLVSVGYIVRKMKLESVDGDVETHRVTDWQPFEVSVVAVPADTSVGVGRSAKGPEATTARTAPASTQTRSSPSMAETTTAPGTAAGATTETRTTPVVTSVNDIAAERTRVKDLNAAAKVLIERHPKHADSFRQLASKCAETGDSMEAFNRSALDILGTQPLTPVRQDPNAGNLGLSKGEIKRYSILRAINLVLENKPLDGFERECNDALAKKLERQPKGFFLPDEIIADKRALEGINASRRTLLATSPVDGGYTVGHDILSSELVSLLRNQTRVVQLGARFITGLVGDISIPRQLTGAVVYWVSETGSITSSSATFGQIVGRPRRVGTSVPYSKQFLAQSSLDAESFVVNDSDEAIAVELDRVAIRGTGGAEPLGILNLPSGERSTSVTFGGAATWAKYLEFFANVASNNALLGTPAYLTTPAAAVKAMSIPKFTNGDEPIWTNDGKIGMFKAEWSNQFPTSGTLNQVIFGDFSQVIFLEWAGRDVVVDPYSGKKEGTVEITIQRLIDMVIRRGKSFAISSDTAAA